MSDASYRRGRIEGPWTALTNIMAALLALSIVVTVAYGFSALFERVLP